MERWWLDERRTRVQSTWTLRTWPATSARPASIPPGEVEALRRQGLGPDAVVVDLGAGTGAFALAVARHCGRVVAVDVSPAMTAVHRIRVKDSGLGNVAVVEAGFLSYEHKGDGRSSRSNERTRRCGGGRPSSASHANRM